MRLLTALRQGLVRLARRHRFDGEACIALLRDRTQAIVERDAAAESLMHYPTAGAVAALFEVASDPGEELELRETAAVSLGAVWLEIGVDEALLSALPEHIRFEVLASMPADGRSASGA